MLPLKISDILSVINGRLIQGDVDVIFTGVSTDTRSIKPGDLFIALIGENTNGHIYAESAISSGAAGIIVSEPDFACSSSAAPIIAVEDTLFALGETAGYYRNLFDIKMIGVTGSVGKTMTREMIASIIDKKFKVLKNEMNFNNEIGVPMTLFKLDYSYQIGVIEMAMRGIGEIKRLAEISQPSIGVITNIGDSHIERLGSRDKIADAKSELISLLPVSGYAILNKDDEYYEYLCKKTSAHVVSFGFVGDADISAENVISNEQGFFSFTLNTPIGSIFVQLPVMGMHSVKNALAASAASYCAGADLNTIAAGLSDFQLPSMRMEFKITENGCSVLNDCYNASPASMQAALQTLGAISGYNRKIAVLGDMFELGDFAHSAHHDVGNRVLENGINILVAVGDLSKETMNAAIAAGMPVNDVHWCANSDEAASFVKELVRADDLILIKGSRGMQMEKIFKELINE